MIVWKPQDIEYSNVLKNRTFTGNLHLHLHFAVYARPYNNNIKAI